MDPPIWIFDDLLPEDMLKSVDNAFEDLPWQSMNGRWVRMVELPIKERLEALTQTLSDISHIENAAPCGKAWIMDVMGRNQGPHMDGWEVEKSRESMDLLDLSRCSVQCHKGFNTVIPTLSFVVYFNDSGGCAFPRAALPRPTIPAKRGRILMFQNYHDAQRPAHNPKAVHYGVYGDGFKRVMTAGVMSSETPRQLSGPEFVDAPKTTGFLYAPIMHRSNTSCGDRYDTPPPSPAPKPKERPVLQLHARPADAGGFIVEATNLAGNQVAKVLIEADATLGILRRLIGIDSMLVCNGEVLEGPDTTSIRNTTLLRVYEPADAKADVKDQNATVETPVEMLVEWDVIDTVFAKKVSAGVSPAAERRPRLGRSQSVTCALQ